MNNDSEFDTFEREMEKLTKEQLEQLVIEEGVYKHEQVKQPTATFSKLELPKSVEASSLQPTKK